MALVASICAGTAVGAQAFISARSDTPRREHTSPQIADEARTGQINVSLSVPLVPGSSVSSAPVPSSEAPGADDVPAVTTSGPQGPRTDPPAVQSSARPPSISALRAPAYPAVLTLGAGDLLVAPWRHEPADPFLTVQTFDGTVTTAAVLGRIPGTGLTVLRSTELTASVEAGVCADLPMGTRVEVLSGSERVGGNLVQTATEVALLDAPSVGPAVRIELEGPAPTTGAPVVVHDGQIIAVVVASSDRVVYAIPIEVANRSAVAFAAGQRSVAWLGIGGNDGLTGPTITEVDADSPAARGGLRAGDVVRSIDGRHTRSMWSILVHIRSAAVGVSIKVAVARGSDVVELTVTLDAPSETAP